MMAAKSKTRKDRDSRATTVKGGSSEVSMPAHVAVTTQQSSDLIQTFLYSAISTILWMRDLLPDEYFRTAFYAAINKHCSYQDFTREADDDEGTQRERSRLKGYHLRVLKKKVSTRGDQIIEWLVSMPYQYFESISSLTSCRSQVFSSQLN